MPEVFLATAAVKEMASLSSADRRRVEGLLRGIDKMTGGRKVLRIHSEILDTSLFLVKSGDIRFIYELSDGRAIVLSIHRKGKGGKIRRAMLGGVS
ncbi:MAG TPA: hypothetical protein VM008_10540 [Phycisphaerae bacterium]|nr:hypothetical protein [Phycisphaerae bacterium]